MALEEHENEHPDRLWGVKDEARPLAVQMWDNDPDVLAAVGAKLAHEFNVSVVDINFGCPVKQVTVAAHSGSYLLRTPDRIGRIIEKVVAACAPTPVTAKIRLGCARDCINAIDVAQVVEGAGAAALTVHGRVAADYFSGSADWDRISAIKPHLKRIPLIGNGDIDSAPKAVAEAATPENGEADETRQIWQSLRVHPGPDSVAAGRGRVGAQRGSTGHDYVDLRSRYAAVERQIDRAAA
jgi:tRNA-dihydrouridine synthase B